VELQICDALLELMDYFFQLGHLLWETVLHLHFYDRQKVKCFCEPFPVLQVVLLVTDPCDAITMPCPCPTSLSGKDFPILPHSVVLEVHFVLASKPGWLVLCLFEIVEGKLRLDQ
jgi:hypothetical protein